MPVQPNPSADGDPCQAAPRPLTTPWILALALLATVAAGCAPRDATVAVVLPETGAAGVYGAALRRGIELAAAHLAEQAGAPISVAFYDSEGDPEKARQLLELAFRRGASAAIGGVTSAEALAMVPVADRAKRVLVSPTASTPQLAGASPFLFRLFPSDDQEAASMARFTSQTLGIDEVVLVADRQAYGSGVRDAFTRAFARYLGTVTERVLAPDDDPAVLADALAKAEPRAVFLATYAESLVPLVTELRAAGYEGRILTTHAFATPAALAAAGPSAVGVLVPQTDFAVDRDAPRARAFVDAFTARYGDQPSLFAAYGYDALVLLAEACSGAGGEDVRRRLRTLRLDGITGRLAFNRQGDVERSPRVHIVGEDLRLIDFETHLAGQRAALIERLEALRQNAAGRD